MHLYPKKSRFPKIGPKAIPYNPKLHIMLLTPADHRNIVITNNIQFSLRIYPSLIFLFQFVCWVHAARYRSSCIYFSFHLFDADNLTILFRFPYAITWWWPTISVISRFFTLRCSAVLTFLNGRTIEMFRICSMIVLTILLGYPLFHSEMVNLDSFSSLLTVTSSMAVYYSLDWKSYIRKYSIAGYVYSVSHGACGGLSPATPAISRSVLVCVLGEVVYSFYISPVEVLRKIFQLDVLVRTRTYDSFKKSWFLCF